MSVLPQFHGFFVGGNEFAFREGFKRQKDHDFEGDVSGGLLQTLWGPRLNRESEHQPPDKMVVFSDYRVELIVRSYGAPI